MANTYPLQIIEDGATHYWRLNESSGNAVDCAGGATAVAGTGITYGVTPGPLLDPTSKGVTLTRDDASCFVAPIAPPGKTWSMEFSIYVPGPLAGNARVICGVVGGEVQISTSESVLRVYRATGGFLPWGAHSVAHGAWHHVVVTSDPVAARTLLYVNGVNDWLQGNNIRFNIIGIADNGSGKARFQTSAVHMFSAGKRVTVELVDAVYCGVWTVTAASDTTHFDVDVPFTTSVDVTGYATADLPDIDLTGSEFIIGKYWTPTYPYGATISEVALFDGIVLTPAQILDHYNLRNAYGTAVLMPRPTVMVYTPAVEPSNSMAPAASGVVASPVGAPANTASSFSTTISAVSGLFDDLAVTVQGNTAKNIKTFEATYGRITLADGEVLSGIPADGATVAIPNYGDVSPCWNPGSPILVRVGAEVFLAGLHIEKGHSLPSGTLWRLSGGVWTKVYTSPHTDDDWVRVTNYMLGCTQSGRLFGTVSDGYAVLGEYKYLEDKTGTVTAPVTGVPAVPANTVSKFQTDLIDWYNWTEDYWKLAVLRFDDTTATPELQGISSTVTASESSWTSIKAVTNPGGGASRFETDAAHYLEVGAYITISGIAAYNGNHIVSNVPSSVLFDVLAAFDGSDQVGSVWDRRGGTLTVSPAFEVVPQPGDTFTVKMHQLLGRYVDEWDVSNPGVVKTRTSLQPYMETVHRINTGDNHSCFAADGTTGELFFINNVQVEGAKWIYRNAAGVWSKSGYFHWSHNPSDPDGSNRIAYQQVRVKNGAVHILTDNDEVETIAQYHAWKLALKAGISSWDWVFNKLFYWSAPDMTAATPFSVWQNEDHSDKALPIVNKYLTDGGVVSGDVYVDAAGDAHIIWAEEFTCGLYPDGGGFQYPVRDQAYLLHHADPPSYPQYAWAETDGKPTPNVRELKYAKVHNGVVGTPEVLETWTETVPAVVPANSYAGVGYHVEGQRVRLHGTPDGRLFAIYRYTGTDGTGMAIRELRAVGAGPRISVPLTTPFYTIFTNTERGGSRASNTIDIGGFLSGSWDVLSYAQVRLFDTPDAGQYLAGMNWCAEVLASALVTTEALSPATASLEVLWPD